MMVFCRFSRSAELTKPFAPRGPRRLWLFRDCGLDLLLLIDGRG
jgi:hypothetical protein